VNIHPYYEWNHDLDLFTEMLFTTMIATNLPTPNTTNPFTPKAAI